MPRTVYGWELHTPFPELVRDRESSTPADTETIAILEPCIPPASFAAWVACSATPSGSIPTFITRDDADFIADTIEPTVDVLAA